VPLNITYEHQLTFDSESDQTAYFKNKSSFTFTDFTYQRESQAIRVPQGYDSLYNCNYLMYRNNDFGGKWFYGFITKREYVNPNMTLIHFELDVYQTWQFLMDFKPSFVAREHCKRWNSDGSPIINTVDEGLNYGTDYITKHVRQVIPFDTVFFLVIVCSKRMDTNGNAIEPTLNGGIQPLTYYVHPFKMDGTVPGITVDGQTQILTGVQDTLKALYTLEVAVNNVVSLYITEHVGNNSLAFSMDEFEPVTIQGTSQSVTTLRVKNMGTYKLLTKNLGNKYDNFTPVTESKLLMHPYTVTVLTDLKGNHQEIKNEYIQDTDLNLTIKGSIGTSNKVTYNVKNYLLDDSTISNSEVNLQNSIINNSPNDVPIITDLLSAYLQGNRNTLAVQKSSIISNQVLGVIGSAVSKSPLGVVGSAVGGYQQMLGILAKQKDIDNIPPSLSSMGGNTAYDYGNGVKGVYVIKKEITDEYRKKLTDFFKMYGYKLNEVKVPNLKTRQHFNFVQTVGANITGNIPQEDIEKLVSMFNNGVTLWHGDWVGDYSLTNGEL
jgi:hypothetical protein